MTEKKYSTFVPFQLTGRGGKPVTFALKIHNLDSFKAEFSLATLRFDASSGKPIFGETALSNYPVTESPAGIIAAFRKALDQLEANVAECEGAHARREAPALGSR